MDHNINPTAQNASLRAHAYRGLAWLGSGTILAQLLRFTRNIILTRLLAPDAFGSMAIVLSISSLVDMITEIGIKEAVIQNPRGGDHEYVNAAWWLSFSRALVIYGILFVAAPFVADFYRNPALTSLMRTALLSVVFLGAMSSRAFVALKGLDFKRWSMVQYGSSISGTAVAIVLTYLLRNVWALAAAYAAEFAVLCVLSYIVCPFVPRLKLDSQAAKDLLNFSKRIFGLSFLNLLFARADVFVLGRIVSAKDLGIYAIAINLAQVPGSFALTLLGQILMPMYSRLQADPARINRIILKVTSAILAAFMPALIFITLSGKAILSLLYGPLYVSGSLVLLLAFIVAFVNVVNGQITTVLYATGHPELHRQCVGLMATLMLLLVYPGVRYFGALGAQSAALVAVACGYALQIRQIGCLTACKFTPHLKHIALPAAGFALLLGIALRLHSTIPLTSSTSELIFGMAAGVLALSTGYMIILRTVIPDHRKPIA